MRILVIIVNYCAAPLVVAGLRALAAERGGPHDLRAVVVDNPGGDDSLPVLRAAIAAEGWGDWVEVAAMPVNGGFAYGVNAAVRPALKAPEPPDAFWLLNPDTWVRPGALVALTRFLDGAPEAGMVGSRLEDPDGSAQHSRFRFPSLANELDNALGLGIASRLLRRWATCPPLADEPHRIDWLSGASLMIRRSVFTRVGLFDEGYFLYFEELDFARRAAALGIQSWYVPTSRVVHLVGQSTGVRFADQRPGRIPSYWFASRGRYLRKHHGWFGKLLADLIFVAARSAWHLARVVRRRPDTSPPHFLADFVRHNFGPGRRGEPAATVACGPQK